MGVYNAEQPGDWPVQPDELGAIRRLDGSLEVDLGPPQPELFEGVPLVTVQPPAPPPLDEAEVIARAVAPLNPWAGVVMAELDRLKAVEKAATELRYAVAVKLWHVPGPLYGPMDALDQALGTEDWRFPELRPDDE